MGGGHPSDEGFNPRAIVYSSSGVGGYEFIPFEYPFRTIDNLPWNE